MGSRKIHHHHRHVVFAWWLLFCALPALTQTLAHRNWQGSGLTAESWWTRATFCEVDPHRNPGKSLHSIVAHLDDLKTTDCDALLLDILSPPASSSSPASLVSGTLDDADELIEQMGRRKIRLMLVLDHTAQGETRTSFDQMRFWLARGASGFLLRFDPASAPAEVAAQLHQAHQIASSSLGTRVLIAEAASGASSDPSPHRTNEAQLNIKRVPLGRSAGELRARLRDKFASLPLLAAQAEEAPLDLARLRIQATILLGNGSAALLPSSAPALPKQQQRELSAEELQLWVPSGVDPLAPSPEQELADWYRSIGELRRASSALRTGDALYLDRDQANVLVWIVKPKVAGSPLLFVCNLSGRAVHIALTADLRALGIRGSYLRTLLTSEAPTLPATLDAIDLSASGVFAGEIR